MLPLFGCYTIKSGTYVRTFLTKNEISEFQHDVTNTTIANRTLLRQLPTKSSSFTKCPCKNHGSSHCTRSLRRSCSTDGSTIIAPTLHLHVHYDVKSINIQSCPVFLCIQYIDAIRNKLESNISRALFHVSVTVDIDWMM